MGVRILIIIFAVIWHYLELIKFFPLLPSEITQISDLLRKKLISQLTKGISRLLQTLRKYFDEMDIFANIVPAFLVLSNNFHLN